MKNLFASMLFVASICMVSCEGKKHETSSDSTKTDSSTMITTDTTTKMSVDTSHAGTDSKMADTTKMKMKK